MKKLVKLVVCSLIGTCAFTGVVGAAETTTDEQTTAVETTTTAIEATTNAAETSAKEVKCYVRITGSEEWTPRVELTVSADASKVLWGDDTENVMAVDALVEACYYSIYGKDPSIEDLEKSKKIVELSLGSTTVESGWMDGIMGDYGVDNSCWMLADGKISPSLGIVDYEITTESDLWFYYTDWMLGYRGYFDKAEYTITEGEKVSVVLSAVPVMNEMFGTYEMLPLKGTVIVEGENGTYTAECDENGNAVFSDIKAGTYTLTAKWVDEENGYVLVLPTAKLTVNKIPETTEKITTEVITTEAPTTKANLQKVKIKKLKNIKGRKAKLKISKIEGATSYQIKYSTTKKFKKAYTKVKTTKKLNYTIKRLKKGQKYYVKVRACKKVGTLVHYGKWSKVKYVKIKK